MSDKKDKPKGVEIYITRSPQGYAYNAGEIVTVPASIAKRLKEMNCARDPQETLPKDMPYRKELIEAGHESVEQVKEIEDLTEVKGIGKVGAEEIAEYLKGE